MNRQAAEKRPELGFHFNPMNWPALLFLLAGSLVYAWRHGGIPAFWPTADGFPYFEARLAGNGLDQSDFFTAASLAPNPRMVFYSCIEYIAKAFGCDYFQVLTGLFILLGVLVPILLYRLLLRAVPTLYRTPLGDLALAGAIACWTAIFDHRFAIASWQPLALDASAQGLSYLLALPAAAGLLGQADGWRRYAWLLLLGLATLIHPVNVLAVAAFICMVDPKPFTLWPSLRRWLVIGGVAWLLPALLIASIFASDLSLSDAAFIDLYAHQVQPFHYDVGLLLGQTKTWLTLLPALVLGGILLVLSRNEPRSLTFRVAAWTVVFGPVVLLVQWLVVEVVPTTRFVMLGPTRLLAILPWLIVVTLALLLGRRSVAGQSIKTGDRLTPKLWAVVIFVAVLWGLWPKPRPIDQQPARHQQLYTWLQDRTAADDVIAAVSLQLEADIRHFAHRPVLLGNNFPFNPAAMQGFSDRWQVRQAVLRGDQGLAALKPFGVMYFISERPWEGAVPNESIGAPAGWYVSLVGGGE